MKKILYIIAAGAMLLASCSKENDTPNVDDTAVQFSTEIATRASGTAWDAGDAIGVFMKTAGQPLSGSNLADNVKYTTNGTNFTTTTPIYYPQVGAVDFVAYYPYTTPLTDYKLAVDVTAQNTPAAIDLLWSANATNVARSKTAVPLVFDHKLSRMVLNIKAGEGMTDADLAGVTVKITGMPTKADFKLATGAFTTPTVVANITPIVATTTEGYVATYTAIVVPQAGGTTGRKMVFTVGGLDYDYAIPDTDDFVTGKNYSHKIEVNAKSVTVSRGTITDWVGTTGTPEDLGEATQIPIPIPIVFIPAGTFLMGSSDGSNIGDVDGSGLNTTTAEPNRQDNETQHEVTLTKDFYMSKYQITNAQYAAFLNANNVGEDRKLNVAGYGEQVLFDENTYAWTPEWNATTMQWEGTRITPMIQVSWFGAKAYADWIGGSLPTEAQWEYACRAGTITAYSFGADATNIDDYALYFVNKEVDGPNAVGSKLPNPWGLYDMHGNVAEWCSDWYGGYASDAATDPTGPTASDFRAVSGGCWLSPAQNCRSAYRSGYSPDYAYINVGLRVVFVL